MKGFLHTLKKSNSTGENLTFLLKAKDAVCLPPGTQY